MHERIQQATAGLQEAYNQHRALELDGTQQVSVGFFEELRNRGLVAAWHHLVDRQKSIGTPDLPPQVKAAMNLVGSFLLVSGVRELAGISQHGRLVNPYRDNFGQRLPLKQRVGETLFNISLGLLFTAQDGGYDSEYGTKALANEHRAAGHRQIDMCLEEGQVTPEDAERKHEEYDTKHGWK